MSDNNIDWMDEEDSRAETQAKTGERSNPEAPQLVRKEIKAPPRATKGFYIQELHSMAFDRVVFAQKQAKGNVVSTMETAIATAPVASISPYPCVVSGPVGGRSRAVSVIA